MIQKALSADHEVTVAETSRRGHAARLAQGAAATGTQVVIVLGGDGTLNEAANGLAGTSAALAPLPGGSPERPGEEVALPVARAVARALSVREQPNQSVTVSLVEALRDRQLLLVLDNCEHLVDACASLAQMLLEVGPPDVLVVDLAFGIDGVARLLTTPKLSEAQVVTVITAQRPDLGAVIRLIDMGVRAVVDKPLDVAAFHAKMDPLLDSAQVVAVRVWVRVRADQPERGFVDAKQYLYADTDFTPNDNFRRVVMSRTIFLRNSRQF